MDFDGLRLGTPSGPVQLSFQFISHIDSLCSSLNKPKESKIVLQVLIF